jgi:uncharacterized protein YjbI with pentapeptide repeats
MILGGAKLSGAQLVHAKLIDARLGGADLTGADLSNIAHEQAEERESREFDELQDRVKEREV